MLRFLKWAFVALILVALTAAVAGWSFYSALDTPPENYRAKPMYASNGAVATSQPLASQAALQVLKDGGNAVDAAVTAAAVLSVVEPYMTGIGGDMFAIVWLDDEQRLVGINGSGRAGSLMTREAIGDRARVPDEGVKSVTVPGALSGWASLLDSHGTLTLADTLQPAIAYAEDGFVLSEVTAEEWALFTNKLSQHQGARETFLLNGETAPSAGNRFVNPDYANTLRQIAENGPEYLYGGELGQTIAEHLQATGGFITVADMASHEAEWIEPLSVTYKGYRLWELPPNGQGIAALEMLKILEAYDLQSLGHNSVEYLHLLIEAKKLAYADLEAFVGDPEFMQRTPAQLLSLEHIEQRRSRINAGQAMARADPEPSLTTSETTYLTVADSQGNIVSFINSLAGSFGSGIVVPGTGFALQNRGVGLSMQPGRANSVAPGRRPFHTIIPGFVSKIHDDQLETPWLSFGIVGGAQQPQAHVQVMLNMVEFGMNVQDAMDAPRFRHWQENQVSFESAIPDNVVDALMDMGHAKQNPFMATAQSVFLGHNRGLIFGSGQAIVKTETGYIVASDSRRDRGAAVY